jgi:hypothetical protein
MPELFKLLARNCIMGIAAGWTTLALLILSNTAHIGDIVLASANPVLPIGVLAVGFAITFGSIAMGVAIMTLPYDKDPGKGRGLGSPTLPAMLKAWGRREGAENAMIPVPVETGRRRLPSRH